MKAAKAIGILVAVVVLIVVVAVGGAFFYIDAIAKAGIERGATYALDVPTTLGGADVGVFSGTFSMSGLRVSNPEGFDTPHFLRLGEGGVAVSLGTLRKELVELPELRLADIDVNLQRSGGKSNYKVILENLKRFESDEPREPTPGKEPGKEFVIRRVEVTNINAHVAMLPVGGDLTKVDVTVPEIVLTDVGGDGVPMSQLVNVLVQAIMESIVKVGGSSIPTDILNDLEGQLAQLTSLGDVPVRVLDDAGKVVESFGAKADEITKGAEEAVEGAKKDAEDAIQGVKDIFGGKKDDEK